MKKSKTQKIGLLLGPALFLLCNLLDLAPGSPAVTRMASVAILMAVWWITDAIPLFATALLPLVLYPLLGIMSGKNTAPIYINSTVFLFIGGFMIAMSMEKWNLHKRIALLIIKVIGGGPSRIILGFMVAASVLSMWISNTATAIMMVPIGLAIIFQIENKFSENEARKFSLGLMLGIAYACSIGGIATLVGTPPNLSFSRIYEITFPQSEPILFGQWFVMGLPLSIVMLLTTWLVLTRIFYRIPKHLVVEKNIVEKEYKGLGPIGFEEKSVLIVFILTAILWTLRKKIDIGAFTVPGWSELLPFADLIDDGTIAIFMALVLFFIPTKSKNAETLTVMSAGIVKRLPWGIVLLFGGGFALAQGFQVTGLSAFIGKGFVSMGGVHPLVMIFILCISISFLTELTSNTATNPQNRRF